MEIIFQTKGLACSHLGGKFSTSYKVFQFFSSKQIRPTDNPCAQHCFHLLKFVVLIKFLNNWNFKCKNTMNTDTSSATALFYLLYFQTIKICIFNVFSQHFVLSAWELFFCTFQSPPLHVHISQLSNSLKVFNKFMKSTKHLSC